MKCIICREEKEGSDEHIIPDSLGGAIHCYNVCKECNSLLGTNIDVYLTDSILVAFDRERNNLKGKKNDSFYWENGVKWVTKDGQKVKIERDETGERKIKYYIKKLEDKNNDEIEFIGDNKEEVMLTMKKALKRKGKILADVELDETTDERERTINGSKEELINKIDLALLKSCYEFFMNIESEYYSDEIGEKISNFLYCYIHSNESEKEIILEKIAEESLVGLYSINGKKIIEVLKKLILLQREIKLEEYNILAVVYTGEEVFGIIILFGKIWGFYKLSNNSFGKIGIIIKGNNVKTKEVISFNLTY